MSGMFPKGSCVNVDTQPLVLLGSVGAFNMLNLLSGQRGCFRVSITVQKHHDRKQVGEERVYFMLQFAAYHPVTSEQELRQELGGRS